MLTGISSGVTVLLSATHSCTAHLLFARVFSRLNNSSLEKGEAKRRDTAGSEIVDFPVRLAETFHSPVKLFATGDR